MRIPWVLLESIFAFRESLFELQIAIVNFVMILSGRKWKPAKLVIKEEMVKGMAKIMISSKLKAPVKGARGRGVKTFKDYNYNIFFFRLLAQLNGWLVRRLVV